MELRHVSDIKIAHLREDAVIAERPKRGRPPKLPEPQSSPDASKPVTQESVSENQNKPDDLSQPFHGFKPPEVAALDVTKPPPFKPVAGNHFNAEGPPPHAPFKPKFKAWSATQAELIEINNSINCARKV